MSEKTLALLKTLGSKVFWYSTSIKGNTLDWPAMVRQWHVPSGHIGHYPNAPFPDGVPRIKSIDLTDDRDQWMLEVGPTAHTAMYVDFPKTPKLMSPVTLFELMRHKLTEEGLAIQTASTTVLDSHAARQLKEFADELFVGLEQLGFRVVRVRLRTGINQDALKRLDTVVRLELECYEPNDQYIMKFINGDTL